MGEPAPPWGRGLLRTGMSALLGQSQDTPVAIALLGLTSQGIGLLSFLMHQTNHPHSIRSPRQLAPGLSLWLGLAFFLCCLLAPARLNAGPPALRDLAQKRGFYIGAAVAIPQLLETNYQQTLKREFNICVAENAFKMESLRPSRTQFDFSQADKLAEFAATNQMRLRGHTLVWHSQIPGWLTGGKWTREEALQIMEQHIATMLRHFQGKVCAWDVVNEAISDQPPCGVRPESFWTKTVGPDWVEKAFEFARRADPKAVLYYNDFAAEGAGPKADAVFHLLEKLSAKHLVDGVGWQCHFQSGWKANQGHVANAKRIAGLGLELSVTELDFRFTLPTTPEKLATQAESYRSMLRFCLSQPNVKAMLLWGFSDNCSWIPHFFKGQGDALIFDYQYKSKPAYDALAEVLQHAD